ncbi:hypothetical protein V5799_034462 [Amblyomma americanum]|uniref:C2H2-type domain-containing protein n=1 Tax=Amblyomma americanum TaxID=6943 RepID=A0AAQ4DKD5_AMBAM
MQKLLCHRGYVDSDVPTPPLCCEMCNGAFATQTLLDEHQQREHTLGPQGKYCCTYCPYSSDSMTHVTLHERTHTGVRPFVCKTCKKAFKQSYSLTRHLLAHTGDKPYKCTDCGRRFTESSNLSRHRKLFHLDDNPASNVCPHCKKGFCQPSDLKQHLLKHAGQWPHVCSQCGMRFKEITHLRRHATMKHNK